MPGSNPRKKILVTGGSSYLGQHLIPLLSRQHDVFYTYYNHDPLSLPTAYRLDIRDLDSYYRLVKEYQPQIIIQLAGSNRGRNAEEVIRLAAENTVTIAGESNARLIHLSTDSIFDGQSSPYDETDPPSPITEYGRAKAYAEWTVAQHHEHVIIRTSLIYGLSIMDHSTAWISSNLRSGKKVTLFDNQIRQPIWANSLCASCLELTTMDFRGIINIAGRQPMSREDFGIKLLDWWGIKNRRNLVVGPADERWPLDCRLDLMLAERILLTELPGVDEVLTARRG